MPDDLSQPDAVVPITGRRLALPAGPILHLQRAAESRHVLGEFRAWAGYRNLGSDEATDGLAHFQHVLSFADTAAAGRTGVHAHMAHAHIVIPTSGRGVFSYDGVVTEAGAGTVIVQHGGTIHDQFDYSYAPAPDEETRRTPVRLERPPAGAPVQAFGFLELFVPMVFANVEIVPPAAVTPADQATAWEHPYHLPGASFWLQAEDAPDAAYRPVAGRDDLEVRDAGTWGPTRQLVATWILRPAAAASGPPAQVAIPGETGGLEIFYMASGSAIFRRDDGEVIRLEEGDTSTHSQGLLGLPLGPSDDMRLLVFLISARAQHLHERTPEEIARLEALGPRIIRRRELRPAGDTRPVNVLQRGGD